MFPSNFQGSSVVNVPFVLGNGEHAEYVVMSIKKVVDDDQIL